MNRKTVIIVVCVVISAVVIGISSSSSIRRILGFVDSSGGSSTTNIGSPSSENAPTEKTTNRLHSSESSDSQADIPSTSIEDAEPQTTNEPNQIKECVQVSTYTLSAEARAIDDWFLNWGAPPMFDQSLAARPYVAYSGEDLQVLAKNGDREAMQQLGINKVWRALTSTPGVPDYATLWDLGSEEYPFRDDVSIELLESGRVDLYNAAVNGDLYALTDLGLSFSLELVASTRAGTITPEQRENLMIQAASYSNIPEVLIEGLESNFVTTGIDKELADTANRSLMNIVDQLKKDRQNAGFEPEFDLVVPPELENMPELCEE